MSKDLLILCNPDPKKLKTKDSAKVELSDSCKRNTQRFGVWMARENLLPQEIICGADLPSRTAAEKSCKAAGLNAELVRSNRTLGRTTTDSILDLMKSVDSQTEIALFVVNSSVGKLFREELEDGPSDGHLLDLRSTTLIHFRLRCSWERSSRGCGDLVQAIDGKSLPEWFPFPDHRGTELRPRPSYYYRQSAVIPFRYQKDRLEVLVVSTSKGKRWVVPKGIHEPGKTAQDSAANEALEEAGVLGNVLDMNVGRYTYSKWGSTCVVSVYAMNVTRILSVDDWSESHRMREWLPPAEAAHRVHQKELGSMIRSLPQRLAKQNRDENHDG